jgi:hypothetical protein
MYSVFRNYHPFLCYLSVNVPSMNVTQQRNPWKINVDLLIGMKGPYCASQSQETVNQKSFLW